MTCNKRPITAVAIADVPSLRFVPAPAGLGDADWIMGTMGTGTSHNTAAKSALGAVPMALVPGSCLESRTVARRTPNVVVLYRRDVSWSQGRRAPTIYDPTFHVRINLTEVTVA